MGSLALCDLGFPKDAQASKAPEGINCKTELISRTMHSSAISRVWGWGDGG